MSNVRLRRLSADFEKVQEYVRRHPRVRVVQQEGDPPERYQFEYRIRSLRMVGGELQLVQDHLVEVALPRNYPRTPPQCRMLSPVFHPNIAPHAICVGDHWGAGESLQSILIRIGEMLAYQSYNVKSPLNGEAARWVEENKHRVPLDPVSLLVEDDSGQGTPAPASSAPTMPTRSPATSVANSAPAPAAATNSEVPQQPPALVTCPSCQKSYRLPANLIGRKVRCQNCQLVFEVAAKPGPSTHPGTREG